MTTFSQDNPLTNSGDKSANWLCTGSFVGALLLSIGSHCSLASMESSAVAKINTSAHRATQCQQPEM